MVKTLSAPGKYIQGRHLLGTLYERIGFLGKKFAVIADDLVMDLVSKNIENGFAGTGAQWEHIGFGGESTLPEAQRICELIAKNNSDVIIGIGGGKVLDTAKLVSKLSKLPLVIIPTIASTDAPCSGRSVIYDSKGTFVVSEKMDFNPNIVLVDTEIIFNSPVNTFVAGIGDAFSTFYEARANRMSGESNFTGGMATEAAYAMAKLCKNILFENACEAIESMKKRIWSDAFEKVVEANIYLSGVGFENNGCAIAHAIYNGMTAVIKPMNIPHGVGVAFGTIIQLIAEKDEQGLVSAIKLFKTIGLPVCFEDMELELDEHTMRLIAESTCTVSPNAHKMPFKVTPELIFEAMLEAEKNKG